MYVTWLMMLGLFTAVSVLARFFLPAGKLRPFLLIVVGAALYYLVRELFVLHFQAMAVPTTKIANPLLLGICAAFLCFDLSQLDAGNCRPAGVAHLVPLILFATVYGIMSFAAASLSYWFAWLAGSVIIWFAGICYRRSTAAALLTSVSLVIVTWNNTPSLHAVAAGFVFIVLVIAGSAYFKKERVLNLLKMLKLSGLAFLVAGKISPFGILWAQNLPFKRETPRPGYKLMIQLVGDIGLCSIGWLAVPFIVAPGFSAVHVIQLAVMAAIFAFAAVAVWLLRRFSSESKANGAFYTIFRTDEAVLLLSGYLCFTGAIPVILFLLTFVLFAASAISARHGSPDLKTELTLLVNAREDIAPARPILKLFANEADSVPVYTETSGSGAEDILAEIIAEMTHSGHTVVPRLVRSFVDEFRPHDAGQDLTILLCSNPGVLPVLAKSGTKGNLYLFVPYRTADEPAFRNTVVIGNAERPGKNGFSAFKPLMEFFFSNHAVRMAELVAVGSIANTGSKSEPATGLRYHYCPRQEIPKQFAGAKQKSCFFILCDEAPGWPPADYRLADSLAKAAPDSEIILVFAGHKTAAVPMSAYPDIVTRCLDRGQVCTFGSDSAMADAIKALLLQLFPGNIDEAEHMAGYFYPKAFQEPLMLDTGIMLLHTRSRKIAEPELAIALSNPGWQHMAFKEPVRCILMLISPETLSAQEHLDNLAALAHAIRDMQLLKDLLDKN